MAAGEEACAAAAGRGHGAARPVLCCKHVPHSAAAAAAGLQPKWRKGWKWGKRWKGVGSVPLAQGSQLPRSVLSRERLLVFRGETGLGGLLRLELLDAVECLGESESSPS